MPRVLLQVNTFCSEESILNMQENVINCGCKPQWVFTHCYEWRFESKLLQTVSVTNSSCSGKALWKDRARTLDNTGRPCIRPNIVSECKKKTWWQKRMTGKRGATKWTWWSQKMEMRLAALYERWGRWGHAVPAALASTTKETHRAIQPNPGLKKRCPFQKSCFKVTCFQKVVAEHFRWEKGPLSSTYASHQLELLLYKGN